MASTAFVTVTISLLDAPSQTVAEKYVGERGKSIEGIEKARNLLEALASGILVGKVSVFQDSGDGTAATGNVACVQATVATGDTLTVAGNVFTVVASSPSADPSQGEFVKGASDTACAANLAAAINASPFLKGMVTAAGSVGNCALTAVDKGTAGNLIVMSATGTGFTLTQMASGAKGTVKRQVRTFRRGQ